MATLISRTCSIIPVKATTFSEALEMIVAMYRAVGAVLKKQGFESTLVGDEGGFGPRLASNEQAFEVVVDAMLDCGFEPGRDVAIAIDVASTHFFDASRLFTGFDPPAIRPSTAGV